MEQDRRLNRRQQGDLGEASAIEWLTGAGATVLIPFGYSPDYDLVAEIHGRLLRVQVKTSTNSQATPNGHRRFQVQLATSGGNQSWNRVAKKFDSSRCDCLFVLTGDGRRWMIPTRQVEAQTSIALGGPKYSEFEIEPGRPIHELVYGSGPSLQSKALRGSADVGESGGPVKPLPRLLSGFDSHLPHEPSPAPPPPRFRPSRYERKPGQNGRAVINQKRRVTLPQKALLDAGLRDGDWVDVQAAGLGRIVLEKAGLPVWAEPV